MQLRKSLRSALGTFYLLRCVMIRDEERRRRRKITKVPLLAASPRESLNLNKQIESLFVKSEREPQTGKSKTFPLEVGANEKFSCSGSQTSAWVKRKTFQFYIRCSLNMTLRLQIPLILLCIPPLYPHFKVKSTRQLTRNQNAKHVA